MLHHVKEQGTGEIAQAGIADLGHEGAKIVHRGVREGGTEGEIGVGNDAGDHECHQQDEGQGVVNGFALVACSLMKSMKVHAHKCFSIVCSRLTIVSQKWARRSEVKRAARWATALHQQYEAPQPHFVMQLPPWCVGPEATEISAGEVGLLGLRDADALIPNTEQDLRPFAVLLQGHFDQAALGTVFDRVDEQSCFPFGGP